MLVFNTSHQLFAGTGSTKNLNDRETTPTPTPSFVEPEYHSAPVINTLRYPQTNDKHPKTDHQFTHATKENLATVRFALPTDTEEHFRIDNEITVTRTNPGRRTKRGGANSQTVQGPPAVVTVEEIGTDDVVIAYVTKISTVHCLI